MRPASTSLAVLGHDRPQQALAVAEVVLQRRRVALLRLAVDLPQRHAVDPACRRTAARRRRSATPAPRASSRSALSPSRRPYRRPPARLRPERAPGSPAGPPVSLLADGLPRSVLDADDGQGHRVLAHPARRRGRRRRRAARRPGARRRRRSASSSTPARSLLAMPRPPRAPADRSVHGRRAVAALRPGRPAVEAPADRDDPAPPRPVRCATACRTSPTASTPGSRRAGRSPSAATRSTPRSAASTRPGCARASTRCDRSRRPRRPRTSTRPWPPSRASWPAPTG